MVSANGQFWMADNFVLWEKVVGFLSMKTEADGNGQVIACK